jgi:hypothetical protein
MAVLRTEMTHGDKAKAKTAKSSKASAPKPSSKAGENGKGALKAGAESSKGPGKDTSQASPAKLRSGEKAAAGSRGRAKELASESKGKGRVAAAVTEDEAPFNNPVIADAFKHALQKYPNALRKLTD